MSKGVRSKHRDLFYFLGTQVTTSSLYYIRLWPMLWTNFFYITYNCTYKLSSILIRSMREVFCSGSRQYTSDKHLINFTKWNDCVVLGYIIQQITEICNCFASSITSSWVPTGKFIYILIISAVESHVHSRNHSENQLKLFPFENYKAYQTASLLKRWFLCAFNLSPSIFPLELSPQKIFFRHIRVH